MSCKKIATAILMACSLFVVDAHRLDAGKNGKMDENRSERSYNYNDAKNDYLELNVRSAPVLHTTRSPGNKDTHHSDGRLLSNSNYAMSGMKVAVRKNYSGDARLQSETNVISQSDVLHLNGTEDYRDDIVTLNVGINASAGTRSNEEMEDNLTMVWWVQLAWASVFVLMILVAIGGNCIVMWIVIGHKRMRSVTNYFLVNLSCADLLLSIMNCFFNFIYMLQGNWQFGGWYCTVNNFIANTTVAASVFTLTAMCCDRHFAIVHPLHPRMSKVTAVVVIVMIWCLSMALASPCLLYSTTITYRSNKVERTACILIWPDGQPTDSNMDFGYQVLFLVITYVVPMALMSFFYTGIGKVLWGSESIGERTQTQLDAIKSKRKVVKMIIFIVLVFACCWLPYHVYFIYTHFDRSILYTRYVQHVYLAFYWFAMSNAMVNPLIYYWMNAKFRGYFRRAICCWRPLDPELDSNFNGRTFKSTRFEDEETRISLRQLKHSYTQSTTASKNHHSR
ncbi:tachykinin-like peptides receptor 86C isoform X1 [Atheta coriaria]|uniref:tachykinin-like peptides receptor 86C isoform X1 n=1 Tax=Dalotia coriaria TaxID=877792 RepID=UPI0031F45DA0